MSGSFVTILQLSALYFTAVAIGSAIIGQHVVGKVIKAIGRASLIIFILAFTIFVSALTLGMLMCPSFMCSPLSHMQPLFHGFFVNHHMANFFIQNRWGWHSKFGQKD